MSCTISTCTEDVHSYDTHHTLYCFDHGQEEITRLCKKCKRVSRFRRMNEYCYICWHTILPSPSLILGFIRYTTVLL